MTRWLPQSSWPSACEPDVTTDGLVLLEGEAIPVGYEGGEGELKVSVQRMVQGSPVETFEGKLSRPDATSALFASDRPLAPQADYQITALHVGLDGSELGTRFTSAFTTGVRSLAPLAFESAPTLRYEEAESERFECVTDECGEKNCQPGDEVVHIKSVRVGVPPIVGGVDIKPLSVSAQLVATFASGQAPAVATSDKAVTQAGKRSFLVLELPALPSGAQGCVTITATDVAGHTVSSTPVCTELPADDAPYDLEPPGIKVVSELGLSQSGPADTEQASIELASSTEAATAQASTQGCAIGQSRTSLSSLGWLSVVLTLARLRSSRKRPVARAPHQ